MRFWCVPCEAVVEKSNTQIERRVEEASDDVVALQNVVEIVFDTEVARVIVDYEQHRFQRAKSSVIKPVDDCILNFVVHAGVV
jgi:hypothetical protein